MTSTKRLKSVKTSTRSQEVDDKVKAKVLSIHLDIEEDDLSSHLHNRHMDDYLVYTEKEAHKAAAEQIRELVWSFNPSFLSKQTGINILIFEAVQANEKCEGNNDALLSCIDDFQSFADAAINEDGLGHFLAGYDHETNEVELKGQTYLVFRTN